MAYRLLFGGQSFYLAFRNDADPTVVPTGGDEIDVLLEGAAPMSVLACPRVLIHCRNTSLGVSVLTFRLYGSANPSDAALWTKLREWVGVDKDACRFEEMDSNVWPSLKVTAQETGGANPGAAEVFAFAYPN